MLAAFFGIALVIHLLLAHRGEPAAAPADLQLAPETSGAVITSSAPSPYEPPSAELLRARAEIARLRDELTQFDAKWLKQTSHVANLNSLVLRLTRDNEDLRSKNYRLQDLTNMAPRLPRVGAWLGVGIKDAKDEPVGDYNTGVRIEAVSRGGPASTGLRPGDLVIGINEHSVPDQATFKAVLATNRGGTTFAFTVIRNGVTEKVEVNSSDWPQ